MQYSQEHLKTMVYAKFGGQTECIMGNSKIEKSESPYNSGILFHSNVCTLFSVCIIGVSVIVRCPQGVSCLY